MKQFKTFLTILAVGLFVTACGSNKRDISMNIQSDPLGAYTLMQVKYSGQENSDWVYLGPTPVTMDRTLDLDKATEVSLKVIRPGFFEQVKSWKPKDFVAENRERDGILWIPSMVQQ